MKNGKWMVAAAILAAGASGSWAQGADDFDRASGVENVVGVFRRMVPPASVQAGAESGRQAQADLFRAADKNDLNGARKAVAAGADVNFSGANGVTPLIEAAGAGSLDAAAYFLKKGAKVNAADKRGETALLKAVGAAKTNARPQAAAAEMVELLCDKGADVNAADKKGWTPLMRAVSSCDVSAAAELLKKGADVRARNFQGQSVQEVAGCPAASALVSPKRPN